MKANDSFTLTWCAKHENWYQYNCPDCMVDANEEDIKQEGRKEVVEFVEAEGVMSQYLDTLNRWQAKLKEWEC